MSNIDKTTMIELSGNAALEAEKACRQQLQDWQI